MHLTIIDIPSVGLQNREALPQNYRTSVDALVRDCNVPAEKALAFFTDLFRGKFIAVAIGMQSMEVWVGETFDDVDRESSKVAPDVPIRIFKAGPPPLKTQ